MDGRTVLRARLRLVLLTATLMALSAMPILDIARADSLREVFPDALVEHPGSHLLVDIRLSGESPRRFEAGGVPVERLPYPPGGAAAMLESARADFFARLRAIMARHPDRRVVLLCGVGQRSAEAVELARRYGVTDRLAHVPTGLEGNARGPGLLDVVALR